MASCILKTLIAGRFPGSSWRCPPGALWPRHPHRVPWMYVTACFPKPCLQTGSQERGDAPAQRRGELPQGGGYPIPGLQVSGLQCNIASSWQCRPAVIPHLSTKTRIHNDSFEFKRWCAWAHSAQRAQYSSTLLLVFWAGMEAWGLVVKCNSSEFSCMLLCMKPKVGINPFAVLGSAATGASAYDKVIDLLVRASCQQ